MRGWKQVLAVAATTVFLMLFIAVSMKDFVLRYAAFSGWLSVVPLAISALQQVAIVGCYGLLLFIITKNRTRSALLVLVLGGVLILGAIYGAISGSWSIIGHTVHRPYIFFLFLLNYFAQQKLRAQ